MKIWFEALTGKQALLFHHMASKFENLGYQTLFTTRKSGYTTKNLDRLDRFYHAIGEYGGTSLKDKLQAGSDRIIKLADLVNETKPDILVSFSSPDATRTAFGLGIPIVLLNDTPHAEAVARLTISLSDTLIHPDAISEELFSRFGTTTFHSYHGVDEALWIKEFQPKLQVLEKLKVKSHDYMVLRCEESKSAYFQKLFPEFKPGETIVKDIVNKLNDKDIDIDIVAFPRYPEQEEILDQLDVIVPNESVDTLTLLHYAKVVMTGGGTMGREAAMLGTPTIYTFPWELAVSRYIADKGFPLFHFPDHPNVSKKLIELLSMPRMEEDKRLNILKTIETPFEATQQVIDNLQVQNHD